MMLAQSRGTAIIGALHNATAAAQAAAAPDDVAPDSAFEDLCAGYERHHHHRTSNCLHAAAMLLGFGLMVAAVARPSRAARVMLALPPTWYFRRAVVLQTGCGGAAAATWIFRGEKSQRRRGCDADVPWRPARTGICRRGPATSCIKLTCQQCSRTE